MKKKTINMYKIIQNWTIDAEIQKQKMILIKDPMAYFSYVSSSP